MSSPAPVTTNRYVVMHKGRPIGHSSSYIRARKMAEVNYRHKNPTVNDGDLMWSTTDKLFDIDSFTGWEIINVPPIGPGGGSE